MKSNRLIIPILFLPIFTLFSQLVNGASIFFQQSVRYEINLNLNIHENIITSEEKLFYRNNSPDTLEYVWFHLYPNAYKNENSIFASEMADRGINDFFYTKEKDRGYIEIKKISTNNRSLITKFKDNDETELKVDLAKSLAPGDSLVFEIQFKVKIPNFISRMGHNDLRYEITQWYPKIAVYDSDGWHNDGYHFLGEFYGEYGDYKVSFNVPEWMWVAATGENIDKDEIEKINDMVLFTSKIDSLPKKIKRSRLDSIVTAQKEVKRRLLTGNFKNKKITFVAQNVHDFAWACDYRYLIKESFYEKTKILTYVTPKHYIGWEYSNDYASDALRYMSNWYGDYIYPVLNVVESDGPYGGMEYPNLVLITSRGEGLLRTFEEVIFHEIAHQWFYGMLGNNEINDAWLDEGLTMFSEMRFFREKYKGSFSNSKFLNFLSLDQITDHSELMKANLYIISSFDYIPPASERSSNYRSRFEFSNVYVRTAFTLDMLKHELGDSLFNTCMKEYYNRFLLKHVNPTSLINTINDVTGSSWDWFFKQWIYTQEQLNLKAGKLESYSQSEGQFETSMKIRKEGNLKTNCEIEFITKQHERFVKKIFIDQPETEIRVISNDEIISARIDPSNKLLEFNRKDNSTNFSGFRLKPPIFTPSFDKYTLMVSPLANYTDYSKWGIGGTIWYLDFPTSLSSIKGSQLAISALYYREIKALDYSASFVTTTNIFKRYNKIWGTNYKLRGEKLTSVGFEYRFGNFRFENPSYNLSVEVKNSNLFEKGYYKSYQASEGKDIKVIINNVFGLDYRLYSGVLNFGIQKGMKISEYSNYSYNKSYIEFYQNVPITRVISVESSINTGFIKGSRPLQENLSLSPNSNLINADFGVAFGFKYRQNQSFNGKMLGYINQNLTGNEIFTTRSEVNFNLFKVGHEPFFLKTFGEIGKFWNSDNKHQSNKQNFIDSGFGFRFIGYSLMVVVWKNYNVSKVNGVYLLRKNREAKLEGVFITLDLGYLFRVGIQYK